MIQSLIDPGLKDVLDLGEVAHHALFIQRLGAQLHLDFAVVPVKVPAFSFVVQKPMAVAEMNFLRHLEHKQIIIDP
jgi:hypothetical protein